MKKHRFGLTIDKNSFQDSGDGIVSFPSGQVITDDSKQRNGTKYDIPSMDLSEYKGQITADHTDMLQCVIGKALGVAKTGNAVTISGIKFATQNPLGQFAYEMFTSGFLTDFSIETYGPWPDEEDSVYYNAKLVGLSMVVVGNNKSATTEKARELVLNSIEQAKTKGLDTSDLEKIANELEDDKKTVVEEPSEPKVEPEVPEPKVEPEAPKVEAPVAENQATPPLVPAKQEAPKEPEVPEVTPEPEPTPKEEEITAPKKEQQKMLKTIKNSRDFAITVKYKNAAGDDVETELAPGKTVDVVEDQAEAVEKQVTDAEAPKPDLTEAIKEAVNSVKADFAVELEKVREEAKQAFDAAAKEPEFKKEANGAPAVIHNKYDNMSKNDRMKLHLESLASAVMGNNLSAMKENEDLNQYNLDRLKAEGKVDNAINLGQLGNFVLGPEYLPGVVHNFSNFTPLLQSFQFEETLDIRTSWLEQIGDLTMTDTNMSDVGDNTNLKPVSEYSTTSHSADLTEFAAVTPVDASAIRFAATDIIGNLNKNYNNAYDKALATSVIGQIAKTLTANGQYVPFDYSAGAVNALIALTGAYEQIAEFSPNGVILLTEQSRIQLLNFQLKAGANGPFANLFSTGIDGQPTFLDRSYVTVPSILMPKLNTAQTKSLVFEGQTVTNNFGLLIADPNDFMGRVSGGLSYTVSAEAAYEVGGVVKSAFQRDQLVFRGYGYRKSAVLKTTGVAGISAPGIS